MLTEPHPTFSELAKQYLPKHPQPDYPQPLYWDDLQPHQQQEIIRGIMTTQQHIIARLTRLETNPGL